jgi:hypothetical protein
MAQVKYRLILHVCNRMSKSGSVHASESESEKANQIAHFVKYKYLSQLSTLAKLFRINQKFFTAKKDSKGGERKCC